MAETLKSLLLVLAVAYLAVLGYVFLFQDRMIYFPGFPGREVTTTPAQAGLPFEAVTLHAADGVALDAWWVPAARARGALVYLHGNAGNIGHRIDGLRLFNGLGLSVLILDWRGYGHSEGAPSEAGLLQDARAAWRHVTQARGVAPARVVVFGESLGAAVAARLAAEQTPGLLVLNAAFTSAPDLAADLYPFLPVRWLARMHYDTEDALAQVAAPLLIAHSVNDEIVPARHAERLLAAARGPKEWVRLQGGHNDLFWGDVEAFRAALASALDRHL